VQRTRTRRIGKKANLAVGANARELSVRDFHQLRANAADDLPD
jgi:hypothetical protein